jgi:transmembrane regulatory protein ToxS
MQLNKQHSLNIKKHLALIILLLSAALSAWLYWSSDFKTTQLLTSQKWESNMTTRINTTLNILSNLKRADINSNVVYHPNGKYSKDSIIKLYSEDGQTIPSEIHINESGKWSFSGQYLIINPIDFSDVTANATREFSKKQITEMMKIFKMQAERTQRVDIINNKTLLLTSLNNGSAILFTH